MANPKDWTTITIRKKTWKKLSSEKEDPSDTFDMIINSLLDNLKRK